MFLSMAILFLSLLELTTTGHFRLRGRLFHKHLPRLVPFSDERDPDRPTSFFG